MRLVLRLISVLFLIPVICFGQSTSDFDALVQKGKAQLEAGSADQALAFHGMKGFNVRSMSASRSFSPSFRRSRISFTALLA
jgi:hypothetical protein